jgi:hypothetical protein
VRQKAVADRHRRCQAAASVGGSGQQDSGSGPCGLGSPSEVREGLVGLGHAVRLFANSACFAIAVGSVLEFLGQAIGHGLALFTADSRDEPPECQALAAALCHWHRHLIVGTANSL